VEHHLVGRLGAGRDPSRRRELKAKANGIAAHLRACQDELHREGGAERLARFSRDGIAIVLRSHWLEFPEATAPPSKPLSRQAAKWLVILVPLPLAVVAQSLGFPTAGVTIVAAAFLLANLMLLVDKDHFAAAWQMTTSLTGAVKQLGGSGDEGSSENGKPANGSNADEK
jgi:hypothetical protein